MTNARLDIPSVKASKTGVKAMVGPEEQGGRRDHG